MRSTSTAPLLPINRLPRRGQKLKIIQIFYYDPMRHLPFLIIAVYMKLVQVYYITAPLVFQNGKQFNAKKRSIPCA